MLPLPCPSKGLSRLAMSLAPPVEHRPDAGEIVAPSFILCCLCSSLQWLLSPTSLIRGIIMPLRMQILMQFILGLRPGHICSLDFDSLRQLEHNRLAVTPFKHARFGMLLPLTPIALTLLSRTFESALRVHFSEVNQYREALRMRLIYIIPNSQSRG